MAELLKNFPKISSPFIRKIYTVNKADWKQHGSKLGLRSPEVYLVTPVVAENMEWVFDKDTYAVEKLHGTNLCIDVQNNKLIRVQNRLNEIDFTKIRSKKYGLPPEARFLEGILNASDRGYVENNKIQYGEFIGPKMNGNMYQLDRPLWYPFTLARELLRYRSFNAHPKEFWGWCDWFRCALHSLVYSKLHKMRPKDNVEIPFCEGIVIYKDSELDPDKAMVAKLRRDMFPWYYWDKMKIEGLDDFWLDYANSQSLKVKGY